MKYTVKFDKISKFGIYRISDNECMESGFSSKQAAVFYMQKEYMTLSELANDGMRHACGMYPK
jgi:hypothetical protein